MSEIKLPTVGRQVLYYPNGADAQASENNTEVLPATVVQAFGTLLNLAVTCMNETAPVVLRFSVPHRAATAPGLEYQGRSYWDWPEIK